MEKTPITLKYYITEQHGYIETSITQLRKLKISKLVSEFSKKNKRTIYLEEDVDATLFVKRLNLANYDVILKEDESKKQVFFDNMPRYEDNICEDKQFDGFVSECEIHQDVIFVKKDNIKKLRNNTFELPDKQQIKIHPSFFLEGKLLTEKQLKKLGIEIIAVR